MQQMRTLATPKKVYWLTEKVDLVALLVERQDPGEVDGDDGVHAREDDGDGDAGHVGGAAGPVVVEQHLARVEEAGLKISVWCISETLLFQ